MKLHSAFFHCWIRSRLVIALSSVVLLGCPIKSGVKDLTLNLRSFPFHVLKLQKTTESGESKDIYIIPSTNERKLFDVIEVSDFYLKGLKCVSEFKDAECMIRELRSISESAPPWRKVGFIPLADFLDREYKDIYVDSYLLVVIENDRYFYRLFWFDGKSNTASMRNFSEEGILKLAANARCESDLKPLEEPCRRTIQRFFWRHFSTKISSGELLVTQPEGLINLVKFAVQGRNSNVESISTKIEESYDWIFSRKLRVD